MIEVLTTFFSASLTLLLKKRFLSIFKPQNDNKQNSVWEATKQEDILRTLFCSFVVFFILCFYHCFPAKVILPFFRFAQKTTVDKTRKDEEKGGNLINDLAFALALMSCRRVLFSLFYFHHQIKTTFASKNKDCPVISNSSNNNKR